MKKTSLRERKFALTRLRLAKEAASRLGSQPLASLPIRDICEQVEVSEATFFNYFPKKTDLLLYLADLWNLECRWRMLDAKLTGLAAIEFVFAYYAKQVIKVPGAMAEMIAFQAVLREKPVALEISPLEKRLGFPDLVGIEMVDVQSLDRLFAAQIESAVSSGELPANTHRPTIMVALASAFYGTALILGNANPKSLAGQYVQQLHLLWDGFRLAGASGSKANPQPQTELKSNTLI